MRYSWLLLGMLCFCAFCAGCGNNSPGSNRRRKGRNDEQRTVTIFGAASTTNVLSDLIETFERESGVKVVANFASSATLAQQIIKGAGADIFLSANVEWVDAVEKEGLVARRVSLLGNRLVVIVPAASQLRLRTFDDFRVAPIERLALADPSSVPAGMYARQALESLGLWAVMRPKVVAGADVRHALAYVEQGAAEAGIVYATDAFISDRVKIVMDIPREAGPSVVYPMVLLSSAQGDTAAESFYSYLQCPAASAVFEKYGFTSINEPVRVAR